MSNIMFWLDIINEGLPSDEVEKTKMALLECCELDTFANILFLFPQND